MAPYYKPKRDGSIEDFLDRCKENNIPFCFKGFKPYRELWNKGYIEPEITFIRLMFNNDRGDESYLVVGEYELEGLELRMHSGRKGKHDPKDILLSQYVRYWEINGLNPSPKKRKN